MTVRKLKVGQRLRISPSQLRYYELCPGYRPEVESSSAAEEGTLLHKAAETGDLTALDPEQRRAVEFCIANTDATIMALANGRPVVEISGDTPIADIAQRLLAEPKDAPVPKVFHIKELFLPDINGANGGTVDDVAICGTEAFITDHKFGRGLVDPAPVNRQLKAYAFLFLSHLPVVNKVYVRLNCPRQETDTCDGDDIHGVVEVSYTRADMPVIHRLISGIMSAARMQRKRLTPNDKSCLYCGKKSNCPAVGRLAMRIVEGYTELLPPPGFDPKGVLRPQDRAFLQAVTKVVEEWGKAVRADNLKAVLYDNMELPGYALRRRSGTPRFLSPMMAYRAALAGGVEPMDFIMACTASVGNVSAAVAASAKAKGGDADEAVAAFNALCESEKLVARDADVFYLQKVNTPKTKKIENETFKQLTEPKNQSVEIPKTEGQENHG